jgi:glutathione peroxidase
MMGLGLSALAGDEGTSAPAGAAQSATIYGYKVQTIDGQDVELKQYAGEVLLVVNVASECGLTPQYAGLEQMYRKYKDQGFVILGFPANEFGKQEPGTNEQIKQFCTSTFGVTFPMFAKVCVKGEGICPLYKYLTEHANKKVAGEVQWNFQKYLVARDGQVIAKFDPRVKPDDSQFVQAVEEALKAPKPSQT